MKNIMLDLETLSSDSNALVLSIGAVAFDPESSELGEKFYVELTDDTAEQQKRGRVVSGRTVQWWMQQDVQARLLFSEHPQPGVHRCDTYSGLAKFSSFVAANGGYENALIWGNGADFDNIVLGNLYEAFDKNKPWSYSANRCYRTMKNLGTGAPKKATREGVHHNALDDAVTQAVHLQEIFKHLRRRV